MKWMELIFASVLMVTGVTAEAKRMASGKSVGKQSSNVTQREAAPSPAAPSNAVTNNAAKPAAAAPGAEAMMAPRPVGRWGRRGLALPRSRRQPSFRTRKLRPFIFPALSLSRALLAWLRSIAT